MTNILHLPTYVNKKKYYRALSIGIALAIILFCLKSCGTFDVTTSARMSTTSFNEGCVIYARYEDTPRVKYFYVITVDPYVWQQSMDTIRMVLNDLGKTKSVDDAEVYRAAAYRQLNRIAQGMRVDSIINKPKK